MYAERFVDETAGCLNWCMFNIEERAHLEILEIHRKQLKYANATVTLIL